MIPLTTGSIKWGFVCGRANVLEARLLDRDFFISMLSHPRTEDVLRQLQETPLQEFVVPGAAWQDWSQLADDYFHSRAVSLRDSSPDPTVANLWMLQWDFPNVRAALNRQSAAPFPLGMVASASLEAVASNDLSLLPKGMKEEVERTLQDLGAANSPDLDALLDGAYLRFLQNTAAAMKVPVIEAYINERVLAKAIALLWRAIRAQLGLKLYETALQPLGIHTARVSELLSTPDPKAWPGMVPGRLGELIEAAMEHEEDEQIPAFEQMATAHVTQIARCGQGQVSGPERVFSYLAALSNEVYNLKLIVCGRLNRIDASVLRRRLRECYG